MPEEYEWCKPYFSYNVCMYVYVLRTPFWLWFSSYYLTYFLCIFVLFYVLYIIVFTVVMLFFGSVFSSPRRDEVTGEWRRLHNEELNDLYCSPNIVRVIKSRIMRWAGHVWVRRGGCIESWWGNRRERDQWGDLGVDGWIILGWISRRWDVGIWNGLGWLRTLVSAVMNLRVPWNAGNSLTSCKPVSCSRRALHHGVSK